MANLRRLRLHLRIVWSGDTRSILLQPMGRMERTDSRPRNALIHRESGSPPDYLQTPGSSVSTRAHISVQAASRFGRGDLALRARCVREPTLSYTRVETLLELMQGIFICSEPRHGVCGIKERCGGVAAEVCLRSSSVWDAGCIIRSRSRNQTCAGQIWCAMRLLFQTWLFLCLHVSAAEEENTVVCSRNLQPILQIFCLIQFFKSYRASAEGP